MDKITYVIDKINPKLTLKFNIQINRAFGNKTYNTMNLFEMNGKSYLKVDPSPFLTLEIIDGDWNAGKTLLLNTKSLIRLSRALSVLYKNLFTAELFGKDDLGNVIIDKDMRTKFSQRIRIGTHNVLIFPSLIEDEKDNTVYQGATLCINTIDNYVEITIEELELLIYHLNKIDMHTMAIDLLKLSNVEAVEMSTEHIENKKVPVKKHQAMTFSNFTTKVEETHFPDFK